MGILLVIELAIIVVVIIGAWKMYEKAGQPGWACIIPIYNTIVLLKIVGKPWWWILLMFIFPVVGYILFFSTLSFTPLLLVYASLIWVIWTLNMLSHSFGQGVGFTVGLVLLAFIFVPILGFGDAKYLGPYGDKVAFKAMQNPAFDFDKPSPSA
jgi:hypothetical protein